MNRLFGKIKWLPTVLGGLMIPVGILALLSPQNIEDMLPLCIGIVCVGLGTCELISSFVMGDLLQEYIPGMHRIRGSVNLAMGLVFLLNSEVSVMFIAVSMGVWAVTFGLLRLHDVLCRRREGKTWGIYLADAIVKGAVGVLTLAGPLIGPRVWIVSVGIYFVFVGASVVISSLYLDGVDDCGLHDEKK